MTLFFDPWDPWEGAFYTEGSEESTVSTPQNDDDERAAAQEARRAFYEFATPMKWSLNPPRSSGYFYVRSRRSNYVTIASIGASQAAGLEIRILGLDGCFAEHDHRNGAGHMVPNRLDEIGRWLWGDRIRLFVARDNDEVCLHWRDRNENARLDEKTTMLDWERPKKDSE
jgi:hypothetical protein